MGRNATLAVVALAGLLLVAPVAHADCCICQGGASNTCQALSAFSCAGCAAACISFNATMLGCCPGGICSSPGVADSCTSGFDLFDVCIQATPGFCNGTCLSSLATKTPTNTPTATPTSTPTNTPTATPTNTPVPQGGACATPAQCSTGFCVDNVCCDSACTDPSMRCDLTNRVGICASTTAAAPALAPWGLLAAALALAGFGAFTLRRRLRSR